MKKSLILLLFSIMPMSAQEKTFSVAGLAFMSGCWQSPDKSSFEQWMKPEAGSMLGMSRSTHQGRTVFHEFMHIEESDGKVILTVVLGLGAKVEKFTLVRNDAEGAVFENPAIDFPQRIIYKGISVDEIHARIEGRQGGKDKKVEFPLRKAACD